MCNLSHLKLFRSFGKERQLESFYFNKIPTHSQGKLLIFLRPNSTLSKIVILKQHQTLKTKCESNYPNIRPWDVFQNKLAAMVFTETRWDRLFHRCTRVEKPWGRMAQVFAKIPVGVKAFRKNFQGGPLILGFIAFLITSLLKFTWGGPMCTLPLSPSTP
jgi:hypothetical protein